jgi:predicted small secreted protein
MRIRTRHCVAALALAALALSGCGTPAVVKPVHDPLPGFRRDIQAARSAVARTEKAEQDQASGPATPP